MASRQQSSRPFRQRTNRCFGRGNGVDTERTGYHATVGLTMFWAAPFRYDYWNRRCWCLVDGIPIWWHMRFKSPDCLYSSPPTFESRKGKRVKIFKECWFQIFQVVPGRFRASLSAALEKSMLLVTKFHLLISNIFPLLFPLFITFDSLSLMTCIGGVRFLLLLNINLPWRLPKLRDYPFIPCWA